MLPLWSQCVEDALGVATNGRLDVLLWALPRAERESYLLEVL